VVSVQQGAGMFSQEVHVKSALCNRQLQFIGTMQGGELSIHTYVRL
jgi:hypothetical protein